MTHATTHQNNFPRALRTARKGLGISQDAFRVLSSRTYISSLERGLKSPTLQKIDALAEVLNIHPLTLMALAYAEAGLADFSAPSDSHLALLEKVRQELELIRAGRP